MACISSARVSKMKMLQEFVGDRLSAAAEEIFKIVERTLIEYEEEVSRSKWVVDHHHERVDIPKFHKTELMDLSGPYQTSPKWSPSLCQSEPKNTAAELTSGTLNPASDQHGSGPDCSLAKTEKSESDQELSGTENDQTRQALGADSQFQITEGKKPYKCSVCLKHFSTQTAVQQHVRMHFSDKALSYQCVVCNQGFCYKSDLVVHTRKHTVDQIKTEDAGEGSSMLEANMDPWPPVGESPKTSASQDVQPACSNPGEVPPDHDSDQIWSQCMALQDPQTKDRPQVMANKEEEPFQNLDFDATIPLPKAHFDQNPHQPSLLHQSRSEADGKTELLTTNHIKAEPVAEDYDTAKNDNGTQQVFAPELEPLAFQNGANRPERIAMSSHFRSSALAKAGKAFERNAQSQHMVAQKPYKCPHCSKRFSSTKVLVRHVKSHFEPHQCQFCRGNFSQKSALIAHLRIHTGERPYKCQDCHRTFSCKSNLTVHLKKLTRNKPCPECGLRFCYEPDRAVHLTMHKTATHGPL